MFDKFEAFMNKYLTPIANKMDKQRHLSAVKKAMVAMTPLLIIGSFCLIPEAIPNMIGENNPISQWILANLDIIYIPYNVGMALMSLYVAAVISYHLAQSYKLDVPGTLSMGVIAFLMMAVDYTEDGGIMTTYLGPKGLFAAMFASIIAVELYRWCKKKNFTIKMPESVPDFVSRSFEMIPISVIVIGFFLIIRVVCVNGLHTVPPMIFTNLFAPLVGSMDNPFAVTFLQILRCLLFFFGIHPSVLSPITSPISTQFLAENMEMVKAIIEAAEELKAPVMIQTTPSTIKYGTVETYGAIVAAEAKKASVPVCLHLDHGSSFELALQAMKAGYTSVMIDGSKYDFEGNIEITKKTADAARALDIPCEAELGKVGGKEDDLEAEADTNTDPQEAKEFAERTGVTSLAVAIGTAHGFYVGTPVLDKERLSEIRKVVDIPLVLHGASGLSDEEVKDCVRRGICKVNFATELREAYSKAVKATFAEKENTIDPKTYGRAAIQAVKELVKYRMQVCGCDGKA